MNTFHACPNCGTMTNAKEGVQCDGKITDGTKIVAFRFFACTPECVDGSMRKVREGFRKRRDAMTNAKAVSP